MGCKTRTHAEAPRDGGVARLGVASRSLTRSSYNKSVGDIPFRPRGKLSVRLPAEKDLDFCGV